MKRTVLFDVFGSARIKDVFVCSANAQKNENQILHYHTFSNNKQEKEWQKIFSQRSEMIFEIWNERNKFLKLFLLSILIIFGTGRDVSIPVYKIKR